MYSDFDSPDINSLYPGPTSYAISPVPSIFFKSHQPPPRSKAHLIPVEIFSEIFLYAVQANPRSRMELMLVCRRWHDIMLSTPGIHSQLGIYRWTEKKDVARFGRRWLLDVTVDTGERSHKRDFTPVEFYDCFMAATEAAPRWRSLALISFPPLGTYKDLQITKPMEQLESFKLTASCNLGNFLEPFMTTFATTVTSRLTVMEVFHPDAALYLVQPAHLQVFSSLTTLTLICRRMQNPVDILPYLLKLETFKAHRLFLPIYPPTVDLPLIQTLRVLHLKSVSVQWMTGRVFAVLEGCSIIFPHHADAVRSLHMPSCSSLKYESNNLGTLEHFRHPPLARLEVKCGQWSTWRGNLQLAALHPIFAAQSLTYLHLEIQCSEQRLAYMLEQVPALEELWIGLSTPHALSSTFFLAFAAGGCNTSSMIEPSSQSIPPLCRALKRLHLHYKRWLRGAERNALISAFGYIVASHEPEEASDYSLCLSFDEGPKYHVWKVHRPVEIFDVELELDETYIGFSNPHGIVPLSTNSGGNYAYFRHFSEMEFIKTDRALILPIDHFFPLHGLRELRMDNVALKVQPNTQLLSNLPFFHTLKVLHVGSIPSSFFAGQTFHKLERFEGQKIDDGHNPEQGLMTEMPVCIKLVVQLSRLATLKLPRISELGVCIDDEEANYIWESRIMVNANLSGLKLLHLWTYYGHPERHVIDVIKVLRSLPALGILVIDTKYLVDQYVNFFEAFVPMGAPGTSGLNQSSWEGEISGLLCPRLESLQIEGITLIKHPELMPVLKDIVTLHAIIGSPLNSITFYERDPEKKWELIGRDRGFIMEEVLPAQKFRLDI
jgi:hypothetical protein